MELWRHQQKGIEEALKRKHFAFFWEMGTGKTRTVLEVLRRRYTLEKRVMKTLILCPQIVCGNWVNEFSQYTKIPSTKIRNIGSLSGKKRLKALENLKDHIVITNYESFRTKEVFNTLANWFPEILVLDEAHKCKNHKAQISRQLEIIADNADYRYLMTGTPVTNSLEDIFQQFRLLDKGETFGRNFWPFRARYFEDKNARWAGSPNYFPKWAPKATSYKDFSEKMSLNSMVVKKHECMDLPPLVRGVIHCDMAPEQRRMYNSMAKEFIAFVEAEIESGKPRAVVAQMAMTRALRLQQIASGFANMDDGSSYILPKNPKLEALSELLGSITPNHKVIVWACFKQNYAMIRALCKELGLEMVELTGDTPKNEREDIIKRFNEDQGCKVLLGNQGAGGIGVNLTSASYSIYFSKDFSLEKDLQSESRNYRGGSEVHSKITRIDLVMNETIDERVNEALKNKQKISELILTW